MGHPAIDTLQSEIGKAEQRLIEPLEGMKDFARVAQPGENEMQQAAVAAAAEIEKRLDMLRQARTMLEALEASKALEALRVPVSTEVLDDLDAQLRSMTIARALAQLPEATGGTVAFEPTDVE